MWRRLGIPLGWYNLTHDRLRFVLFSAGIALAVILMFVQYGFRNALLDANIQPIEQLNADLVRTKHFTELVVAKARALRGAACPAPVAEAGQ